MGTNYYATVKSQECEYCGRADEVTRHIGKSSAGWAFTVRTYEDIADLQDWDEWVTANNPVITDEYGEEVTWSWLLVKMLGKCYGNRKSNEPPAYGMALLEAINCGRLDTFTDGVNYTDREFC